MPDRTAIYPYVRSSTRQLGSYGGRTRRSRRSSKLRVTRETAETLGARVSASEGGRWRAPVPARSAPKQAPLSRPFCVTVAEDALARHGRPANVNSDQGARCTSAYLTGLFRDREHRWHLHPLRPPARHLALTLGCSAKCRHVRTLTPADHSTSERSERVRVPNTHDLRLEIITAHHAEIGPMNGPPRLIRI